mmetsp:Transcript_34998/g.54695  ORF Transcript_34998/g.54695 Transcript_34998/m.54695 type:complete len:166 (+) Transcript_34998:74-571(+)
MDNLLAIPTWQPAPTWAQIVSGDWKSYSLDLSVYPSQEVNKVRKQLYNKILAWCSEMRKVMTARGHWFDAACPITGNCMFGDRSAHIYNELDGLTTMLGYEGEKIGCCGIVLHPLWEKAAYPVTAFTLAPYEVLKEAIAEVGKCPQLPDVEDLIAKDLVDGDSCM